MVLLLKYIFNNVLSFYAPFNIFIITYIIGKMYIERYLMIIIYYYNKISFCQFVFHFVQGYV